MTQTNKILALLAALVLLSSCGKDEDKKDSRQQKDSNQISESSVPSQSGDLAITGSRSSLSMRSFNGSLLHSHFFIVFAANKEGVKVTSAKLDGIEIKRGAEKLGRADKYIKGVISEESLKELSFGDDEFDREYKNDLLTNNAGQAFFHIENFRYNLKEEERVFTLSFILEAGSDSLEKEEIIDNRFRPSN